MEFQEKEVIQHLIEKDVRKYPMNLLGREKLKNQNVGHSFLPPDRIFGNIEREIRPLEVIAEPEVYFDIFKRYGKVIRLGSDFQFYDWKTSVTNVLKLPGSWNFKFNASKRFFLRKDKNNKIGIKGEPNYVSEVVNYGNVCKRGKSYENIKPTLMKLEFL
ncbi:unnamed protein product [Parnassius apollo]|uniref:(apollo) hypothetical protein n=1 Tax=Parnassius apollo TaxID=110799 RepID=A0A8S3X5A4_PARAO|nr:unnamed protein product [Parnassius apollo]